MSLHPSQFTDLLVDGKAVHVVPFLAANLRALDDVSGYQQVPDIVQLAVPCKDVVRVAHMLIVHSDPT